MLMKWNIRAYTVMTGKDFEIGVALNVILQYTAYEKLYELCSSTFLLLIVRTPTHSPLTFPKKEN